VLGEAGCAVSQCSFIPLLKCFELVGWFVVGKHGGQHDQELGQRVALTEGGRNVNV